MTEATLPLVTSAPDELRLSRLEVRNLFSHEDTSLELDGALNVIAGPNGSGKSSLMEAIFVALYGSKAATVMGRTLEGILRDGAEGGHVRLAFTHHGTDHHAYIELKRAKGGVKTANAELATSGETWSGVSAMTERVTDLLGMTAEDFANCVYVRQGDVDRLINAKPQDRMSMMDRLLKLTDLDSYADRAKSARRALNRRADHLDGQWKALAEQIGDRDEGELRERHEALKGQLDKHSGQVEAIQGQLDEAKAEVRRLTGIRDQQAEIERKRSKLEELAEKRDELAETLRSFDPPEAPEERLAEIEERLNAIPNETQAVREETDKQLAEFDREAARQRVTQLETEIESVEAQIEHRWGLIREGKCPECGQGVHEGTFEDAIASYESRKDDLKRQLGDAQAHVQSLDAERERLTEARDERIEALATEDTNLRREQGQLNQYLRTRQSHDATVAQMEQLATDLDEAPEFNPDDLQAAQARVNDLDGQRAAAQTALDETREALAEVKKALADLQETRRQRDEVKAELDRVNGLLGEVERCASFYATLKRRMRAEKVEAIEARTNQLFALMDNGAAYTGVTVSPDYEITLHLVNGQTVQPAQLSGGERALLNIALRGAIHQVLSGSLTQLPLLLDEPTTHLDRDRVQRLRRLLEHLEGQVLLVTHEEGLMDAADREFRAEKRTDNTSAVERVR